MWETVFVVVHHPSSVYITGIKNILSHTGYVIQFTKQIGNMYLKYVCVYMF